MAPLLIHFSFAHTMTLLSTVHVSVWLQWGCIGSKHARIRPIPDIGMAGQMWLLLIYTPIWKWPVTLYCGGQVSSQGLEKSGWLRECLPVCQLAYGALHVFGQAWNSWRTGGGVKGRQPPLMQLAHHTSSPREQGSPKSVRYPKTGLVPTSHQPHQSIYWRRAKKTCPLALQVTRTTGHLVTTPLHDFLLAAEVRVSPVACPGVKVQSAFHLQGHLCSFDPRCSGLFSDWWGESDYVLMHPL